MKNFSGTATAATRSFLFALFTGASTAALSAQACAQQPSQPTENQERVIAFDIAPQPLSSALSEFARQAGVRTLYPSADLRSTNSPGLRGSYTREEGLARLLENSGHRARINQDSVIELETPERLPDRRADASDQTGVGAGAEEEIVVVGTNIRGLYPASSPVEIYRAEDIERSGATTTEQFIQKLPQNFGTRTQYAAGYTSAATNFEAAASVDLRGLGVGTTLTLLNGRRLALASSGQAADVSLIPVSAIARVEVLTDGASAIYGSDAIGGVVNFVLRDDLDGAETRFNYGGVTSGTLRQGELTQTFGRDWGSGDVLAAYDYFSASALERSDRSYTAASGAGTLTPHNVRHAGLVTVTQHVADRLTFSGDFALSKRDVKTKFHNAFSLDPLSTVLGRSSSEQTFANLASEYRFDDSLTGSFLASYSEVSADSTSRSISGAGVISTIIRRDTEYSGLDLTGMLSGTLLERPAGPVEFAIGGGFLDETFTGANPAGVFSARALGRRTNYVYGELSVPLVDDAQDIPFANRLELTLAARYTRYDDESKPALPNEFGDRTSPKIGVLWGPSASLNLRMTYGESFRAPSLTELDPTSAFGVLVVGPVGGANVPFLNLVQGPSNDLEPETSESYTLGFDYRPIARPSFRLNTTYFNIDYTDRVAQGDSTFGVAPRANPAAWPEIIFRPSSAEEIEEFLRASPIIANTTGISLTDLQAASLQLAMLSPNFWVMDNRLRNLALSKLDGFDVTIRDTFELPWGEVSAGSYITRILDYRQQVTQSTPVLTVVDTALRPADLKARAFLGLERGAFEGTLSVNYVDDYSNAFAAGGPQHVESWTTVDLNASYKLRGGFGGIDDGILNVSIQNLFDEDPPFVSGSGLQSGAGLSQPIGFDPTNANPLGRLIVLGVSTRW